jgi:hypothetical protein
MESRRNAKPPYRTVYFRKVRALTGSAAPDAKPSG